MSSDEIIKIAGEVISEYKFSTIDELIASANKLKLDNFLKVVKDKAILKYTSKIGNYEKILNSKIKNLGEVYISKFANLSDKLISKFDKTKREFIVERVGMMSDEIAKANLDNVDSFIDSFKDGRYPKLLGSSKDGLKYSLQIRKDGILISTNGEVIKSKLEKPVDYIIQNGEIKFGSSHSYISDKKNVDYAGEIYTDNNGKIISINNNSGHYKPTLEGLEEAMKLLDAKVGKVSNLFVNKY